MMAHHVFNRPDEGKMYYWMEGVKHCHDLLCITFESTQQKLPMLKIRGQVVEMQVLPSKLLLVVLNWQLWYS